MENLPPELRSMIVAADDDEDDIELLQRLFRKAGVKNRFEIHRNGEDVIEALTALLHAPDGAMPLVCFLDVKMPAMTGHEVLRWIRQHRPLDAMPVVMLSSSEHPADVTQAAQNGAQCYLSKYPQPEVLQQVVAAAGRFACGTPAQECFRVPANLLLRE